MTRKLVLFSLGSFLALVSGLAIVGTGCKTGTGRYNPATHTYDATAKADSLVVTAEKTGATALDAFDRFMKYERENEAALAKVSPKIHAAAEEIRTNGRTWLLDLDMAKVAYQSNRGDPGNATRLQAALAVIQSAVASALNYVTTPVNR